MSRQEIVFLSWTVRTGKLVSKRKDSEVDALWGVGELIGLKSSFCSTVESQVLFSHNSIRLASMPHDRTIKIWDISSVTSL